MMYSMWETKLREFGIDIGALKVEESCSYMYITNIM